MNIVSFKSNLFIIISLGFFTNGTIKRKIPEIVKHMPSKNICENI